MKKNGFSLAEIMITVVVSFLIIMPIIFITTSSKKDTAHAINYLRAIELGNEVLDLVNSLRFEQINTNDLNALFGESVTDATDVNKTVKLHVMKDTHNEAWKDAASTNNFLADEISYPPQYAQYCFYRDIEVNPEDDEFSNIGDDIKVIKITVAWAESSKVNNIATYKKNDSSDGRNKKIVLYTVVGRDREFRLNDSL